MREFESNSKYQCTRIISHEGKYKSVRQKLLDKEDLYNATFH